MAHTPGPWTVEPHHNDFGSYTIKETRSKELGWASEEDWANAHLIAAAPDLLEALRGLVRISSTLEVLGEWEALDIHARLRVTERAKVEESLDKAIAAMAQAEPQEAT